jgi:hypothetical protein
MNHDIEQRKLRQNLASEISRDPEWQPFAAHWANEGLTVDEIVKSLDRAKFDAWCRKRRYMRLRRALPF